MSVSRQETRLYCPIAVHPRRLQADSYNGSQGDVARERATYDGEENLNAKGSVAQGFAE